MRDGCLCKEGGNLYVCSLETRPRSQGRPRSHGQGWTGPDKPWTEAKGLVVYSSSPEGRASGDSPNLPHIRHILPSHLIK